jgi:hypothetical protein
MAGKLTALGRLIALIALPGQYRLVTKDRVIPEGYKLCPPGSKSVCEGYEGKTLEECLKKLNEVETIKGG